MAVNPSINRRSEKFRIYLAEDLEQDRNQLARDAIADRFHWPGSLPTSGHDAR
jgi:hypothetical protein